MTITDLNLLRRICNDDMKDILYDLYVPAVCRDFLGGYGIDEDSFDICFVEEGVFE